MPSYADVADFDTFGLPADWLADPAITTDVKEQALSGASGFIASYLAKVLVLPLVSWGDELRRATVHVACWDLCRRKGFDSESNHDKAIYQAYVDIVNWLRDIGSGKAQLAEVVDSSDNPEDNDSGFLVTSEESRGWE